jgi:hypothetical protein
MAVVQAISRIPNVRNLKLDIGDADEETGCLEDLVTEWFGRAGLQLCMNLIEPESWRYRSLDSSAPSFQGGSLYSCAERRSRCYRLIGTCVVRINYILRGNKVEQTPSPRVVEFPRRGNLKSLCAAACKDPYRMP